MEARDLAERSPRQRRRLLFKEHKTQLGFLMYGMTVSRIHMCSNEWAYAQAMFWR